MSGFESPNYTQTPNDFFDMLPDMSDAELRVTLIMIRQTFGFHRDGFKMGVGKLADAAGLSRNGAKDGADAAEKRGTFARTNPASLGEAEWSLVVDPSPSDHPTPHPVTTPPSPSEGQVGVKERIKKELKLSEKDIQQVNAKVDAIIAGNNGQHYEGREVFRPDHLPLADWYHNATGQNCPKTARKTWFRALSDWTANGLTPDDLQAAYDKEIGWRGVFKSPMELTAAAIAIKAQKSVQPQEEQYRKL